jgi:hypothetical protein
VYDANEQYRVLREAIASTDPKPAFKPDWIYSIEQCEELLRLSPAGAKRLYRIALGQSVNLSGVARKPRAKRNRETKAMAAGA